MRADFIYARLSPRMQAALDLALYMLFLSRASWHLSMPGTVTPSSRGGSGSTRL